MVTPLRGTGKDGHTMKRRILLVTLTLVLSFGLRVWLNGSPLTPQRESLAGFPKQAGAWTMIKEDVLDESISGVLQADESLRLVEARARAGPQAVERP